MHIDVLYWCCCIIISMKYLISWAAARRKYLIMNDVNKFLFLNAENLHNLKYVFIALNRIRHWQYKQTNEMNCFCSLRTPITCFEINTHTHRENNHASCPRHSIEMWIRYLLALQLFSLYFSHVSALTWFTITISVLFIPDIYTTEISHNNNKNSKRLSKCVCVFVLFVALRNDNFFLSSTYYKYKFCQFWTWCGSLFRCLFLPHFIYFGRYRTR